MSIAPDIGFGGVQSIASATTVATTTATNAAGATVIGCVALKTGTTLTSVVDSGGVTLNILPPSVAATGPNGTKLWVFWGRLPTAASRFFTAHYDTLGPASIMAETFTGLASITPFDKSHSGATSGVSTLDSGATATTTYANEVAVGFASTDSTTTNVTWTGGGWAGLGNSGANSGGFLSLIGSYQIQSATGTPEYKPTQSSATLPGVAIVVTFADTNVPSGVSETGTGALVAGAALVAGVGSNRQEFDTGSNVDLVAGAAGIAGVAVLVSAAATRAIIRAFVRNVIEPVIRTVT